MESDVRELDVDVNSVVVRDVASVSSRVWGVYSESVDSWPAG